MWFQGGIYFTGSWSICGEPGPGLSRHPSPFLRQGGPGTSCIRGPDEPVHPGLCKADEITAVTHSWCTATQSKLFLECSYLKGQFTHSEKYIVSVAWWSMTNSLNPWINNPLFTNHLNVFLWRKKIFGDGAAKSESYIFLPFFPFVLIQSLIWYLTISWTSILCESCN